MVDTGHVGGVDTARNHLAPLFEVRIPGAVQRGLALAVFAAEVLALIGGEVLGSDERHRVLQHRLPGFQTGSQRLNAEILELLADIQILVKGGGQCDVVLLEQVNIVVDALEPRDAGQRVGLAVVAVNRGACVTELCAQIADIGQITELGVLQGRSGRFADDVGTFTGGKLGVHDGVVVGVVDELILDLNIGNCLAQIVKQCLDGIFAVPVGHAQRNLVTGSGAFCRSAAGSALSGGAARGGGRGATAGGEGQSHRRCEHGCDCFFHVCFPPCSVFCFRWLYCTRNVQNAK